MTQLHQVISKVMAMAVVGLTASLVVVEEVVEEDGEEHMAEEDH